MTIIYRGVATIDIELTNIDINQCDIGPEGQSSDGGVDVFRGTHHCMPSTEVSRRFHRNHPIQIT